MSESGEDSELDEVEERESGDLRLLPLGEIPPIMPCDC